MVAIDSTRWPIEPHTQAKHLILRKYLDAWLPIMATYNGRIIFIDGFAGPGRYAGGEEGSPLIALRALLDHPHFRQPRRRREVCFLFSEQIQDRADALNAEIKQFCAERPVPDWLKIEVETGEFAPLMTRVLDTLDREGNVLAPTFAFLDPFGFKGIPMAPVARIARNRHCECLITFMYESINRFLAHPDPAIQARFDELFGTGDWRPLADAPNPEARRDRIVALYRQQLVGHAGFRRVRTFQMINRGNRTEYFLYFGTNSDIGLSKMKQAMWKADPRGGQAFSDRTDPNQMILIQAGPVAELQERLQREFRGRGFVPIEQIEDFVLLETPYSEAMHLKRQTLAPMERQDAGLIRVQRPPGARKFPGAYPPGTQVQFL
jgi:three-Cys-motif partner protein